MRVLGASSRRSTSRTDAPSQASGRSPDGDAYYEFLVRQSTTTDMTPEQIHQIGEQEVARRGGDAGDREEAGLRGPEGAARFDPEQSEAASDLGQRR